MRSGEEARVRCSKIPRGVTRGASEILGVVFAAFVLFLGLSGCASRHEALDLSMYQYRDTKNLVQFVYDAALMLEEMGVAGLKELSSSRDHYRSSSTYLYVYDIEGTNLFHAGMEELEGQNLWDVADKNGKPVFQLVIEALSDPSNPHAWVHYSWWEPGSFYPVPKSSCHFLVTTPEGRVLVVGGGLDYPHEEPEFIRIVVDAGAELIASQGTAAFDEIEDPVSKYNYRDVRVFVFDGNGESLISPTVNSTFTQTNLLECVDEVGERPFARAMEDLSTAECTWEVFMARGPYQRALVRKTLYVRRVTWMGDEMFVAAITDLPEPPY